MAGKRYRVRIAKSGYPLVFLTIAIALAGVNTGNNLLYLIASGGLALMATSGFLSFVNVSRIKVDVVFPPEVYAGIPCSVKFRVRGPIWRCFFLKIETKYGDASVSVLKREAVLDAILVLPKRGRVRIENVWVSSGYPFGFFVRSKRVVVDCEVLVFPKPVAGDVPLLKADEIGRMEPVLKEEGEIGDVWDFRDYREGTPVSRIAWRLSARRGRLVEKVFESIGSGAVLLDLSAGYDESLLSCATHFVLEAFRSGVPVGIKWRDRTVPPGTGAAHRLKLLRELALA